MNRKHGWLIVVVITLLVVAACGPEMPTTTPGSEAESTASPKATTVTSESVATASPKPTTAVVDIDPNDWRVLGSPDAPVTVIEYSDFQCPFCGRYSRETYPQLVEQYVQSGEVRYVFRNFPLYSIHPQAQKAAEAAECAGEQAKYWEMHDALFGSQEQWSGQPDAEDQFKGLAGELGVDQAQFDACLDEGTYADRVGADYQAGIAEGVTGTPAFRINGTVMSGAQPLEAFQEQIDFFLAGGETPGLEVAADSYRSMGRADAPVVVTEFSDYQCPACASVEQQLVPALIEQYVDTGKVRFVYREFPLDSIHPHARKASEAAVCAGEQGAYWEMHEKLFATQSEWSGEGADPGPFFKSYAAGLGLDSVVFDECLDSAKTAIVVQGESMSALALGVSATPTFFINDLPIQGGLPIESLGAVIDYVAAGGPTPEIVPRGEDWHVRGNTQTAQGIMVAFVDYASPESAQHATEVLPQLLAEYVDSGDLIYVLHPWSAGPQSPSALAAAAAECAGAQGKYWEMHGQLFAEQAAWSEATDRAAVFGGYAEPLGLDTAEFEECLASDWASLRVQAGNVVAALYSVPGAPVFLFSNGQGQQDSPTFQEFQQILDPLVGRQ